MLFMYFRGVVGAVATFSSQDSAGLYSDLMQRKERYVHFLAAFGPLIEPALSVAAIFSPAKVGTAKGQVIRIRNLPKKNQCCESGSASRYDFLVIRILPMLFKHIWKLYSIKNTLYSIKKKNPPIICHFLFHTGKKLFSNILKVILAGVDLKQIIRIRGQVLVPDSQHSKKEFYHIRMTLFQLCWIRSGWSRRQPTAAGQRSCVESTCP